MCGSLIEAEADYLQAHYDRHGRPNVHGRLTEPRGVVGFEVTLGAYSPLSIAATCPVSLSG